MLKPLTERQVTLTVNNIVAACEDITKLNGTGYNYIYLASGFIAHYDRFGFIEYYNHAGDDAPGLKEDILANQRNNQWNNFRPGETDYEYYKQKGEIYNKICKLIQYL